ncbi:MAG: hypothetical protein AAGC74_10185 [Verrucomicrobiota bacterium]
MKSRKYRLSCIVWFLCIVWVQAQESQKWEFVLGVDFNCNQHLASPTQARFRTISGKHNPLENSFLYLKRFGEITTIILNASQNPFEFRGANGDPTREIPGGPTSYSFLVSDFIATRDGSITIFISGLTSGTYRFQSFHLDSSTAESFSFAQGNTPNVPATLQALIQNEVVATSTANSLGSRGLASTVLTNQELPSLKFERAIFEAQPLHITLQTTTTAPTGFVLLNGFKIERLLP